MLNPGLVLDTVYSAFGILSVVCSGLVVITGCMFPRQIAHPSKPFSHVIFMISLCDFFGSVGCALGLPHTGTPACTAQAFLEVFFLPASWIWTSILVFQIRCLLITGKLWLKPWQLHLTAWTIVIITTLAPLSTNNLGQDDSLSGILPCNFGGGPNDGYVWSLISVAGVLISSVAFILIMTFQVGCIYRKRDLISKPEYAKTVRIFRTTRLYPVGMLVCWIPYLTVGLFVNDHNFKLTTFYEFALVLTTQYGTLTALIFFTNSSVAIQKWTQLLCGSAPGKDINATQSSAQSELSTRNKSRGSFGAPLHIDRASMPTELETRIPHVSSQIAVDINDDTDYDDERLLYICRVDSTVSENMSDMWRDSDWAMRQSDNPSSHSMHI
jgi:hypothetical protein